MITIVAQCTGFALLLISIVINAIYCIGIVVQCIGITLLMISIVVQCIGIVQCNRMK